jgi:hypothetical protein
VIASVEPGAIVGVTASTVPNPLAALKTILHQSKWARLRLDAPSDSDH